MLALPKRSQIPVNRKASGIVDAKRIFSLLTLLALSIAAGAPAATGSSGQLDREAFEAGTLQYPGENWTTVESPADWSWSPERLEIARAYFEGLDSATIMVVHRGVPIATWGDVTARYNGQSMRKPLLGAMLGQEIEAGRIALDASLEDLGLNDSSQPLSAVERSAKLIDLLQSRTGVYLSALYEAGSWKRNKPERGTHRPGEFWYYNNWGFNALGTVFETISKTTIHDAFLERIAAPIGMQDYRPEDVQYLSRDDPSERFMKNDSEHRAYVFMISTRDMARFALLYLAKGRWNDVQVVPESWVRRSTSESVPTLSFLRGDRFAYLWWVSEKDSDLGRAIEAPSYKATGGRGHKAVVVPDLDLVVIHRLPTGGVDMASQMKRAADAPSVDDTQFAELMRLIVAAHPDRHNSPGPAVRP